MPTNHDIVDITPLFDWIDDCKYTSPYSGINPGLRDTYLNKLYIAESEDPAEAGWGLFAKRNIDDSAIICEYAGRVDAAPSSPPSDYIIEITYEDGTIHTIDAFDPSLQQVLSAGGYCNDPIDEVRENAEWVVINNKLFLKATRDIMAHEQIFAHYGPLYWANDKYPLRIMIKALSMVARPC